MSTLYGNANLLTAATLSAVSSEDAVYPKANLYCRRQSKPLRFTAKTGTILINLGAAIPVTLIAIINHNLTNAATITRDANAANAFPNAPLAVPWHEQNIYCKPAYNLQWILISFSDAGNSQNLEIGELVVTTYGSFPRDFEPGSDWEDEMFIFDQKTPYEQRWKAFKARGRKFTFSYPGLSNAQKETLRSFFSTLSGVFPFVLIPRENETDCWYVEAPPVFKTKSEFYNFNDLAFEFYEQSRGITLL